MFPPLRIAMVSTFSESNFSNIGNVSSFVFDGRMSDGNQSKELQAMILLLVVVFPLKGCYLSSCHNFFGCDR
jgi:hypothetical protein